jgi:hypothetical protein
MNIEGGFLKVLLVRKVFRTALKGGILMQRDRPLWLIISSINAEVGTSVLKFSESHKLVHACPG